MSDQNLFQVCKLKRKFVLYYTSKCNFQMMYIIYVSKIWYNEYISQITTVKRFQLGVTEATYLPGKLLKGICICICLSLLLYDASLLLKYWKFHLLSNTHIQDHSKYNIHNYIHIYKFMKSMKFYHKRDKKLYKR